MLAIAELTVTRRIIRGRSEPGSVTRVSEVYVSRSTTIPDGVDVLPEW